MADAQANSADTNTTTDAVVKTAATSDAKTATDANAAVEDLANSVAPAGEDAAKKTADAGNKTADEGDDLLNGKVKADEKKAEGEGADADAVPEKYDFKVPDGMELDAKLAEEFSPIAKDLGLSNEKAQKLVDLYATKVLPQVAAQQAEALKTIQNNWAKEAKSDPEFGGKNLTSSLALVAKGRDFLGPEFAKEIAVLGIGNNPTLLKGLAKLGKALAEDEPMVGSSVGASKKDAAAILYPEQSKG